MLFYIFFFFYDFFLKSLIILSYPFCVPDDPMYSFVLLWQYILLLLLLVLLLLLILKLICGNSPKFTTKSPNRANEM